MPTLSNWTENLPSDDSLVVKAPEYMRGIWVDTTSGMAESVEWPGTGGGSSASQGELKLGASKTMVDTASNASFGATATHRGRPFFASDTSRLYTYASTKTYIVGTPFLQEHSDYFSGAYWLEQSGSYVTRVVAAGSDTEGIGATFVQAYDGAPSIFARSNDTNVRVAIRSQSGATFSSTISGSFTTITVRWTSLGTVSL